MSWAVWVCALGWLSLVMGIVLQRLQWVHFSLALAIFAVGVLLACVAAIGSLWFLRLSPSAWGVLALGLLPISVVALWAGPGMAGPAIHDISTSPGQLTFERALELRNPKDNSLSGPSGSIVAQQLKAYPDIKPFVFQRADRADVYRAATEQARQMGWVITLEDAPNHFETYEKTVLFGFTDDVKVSLSKSPLPDTDTGVQVDIRSASRVGKSDLGANAERIRTFLAELSGRVQS